MDNPNFDWLIGKMVVNAGDIGEGMIRFVYDDGISSCFVSSHVDDRETSLVVTNVQCDQGKSVEDIIGRIIIKIETIDESIIKVCFDDDLEFVFWGSHERSELMGGVRTSLIVNEQKLIELLLGNISEKEYTSQKRVIH